MAPGAALWTVNVTLAASLAPSTLVRPNRIVAGSNSTPPARAFCLRTAASLRGFNFLSSSTTPCRSLVVATAHVTGRRRAIFSNGLSSSGVITGPIPSNPVALALLTLRHYPRPPANY